MSTTFQWRPSNLASAIHFLLCHPRPRSLHSTSHQPPTSPDTSLVPHNPLAHPPKHLTKMASLNMPRALASRPFNLMIHCATEHMPGSSWALRRYSAPRPGLVPKDLSGYLNPWEGTRVSVLLSVVAVAKADFLGCSSTSWPGSNHHPLRRSTEKADRRFQLDESRDLSMLMRWWRSPELGGLIGSQWTKIDQYQNSVEEEQNTFAESYGIRRSHRYGMSAQSIPAVSIAGKCVTYRWFRGVPGWIAESRRRRRMRGLRNEGVGAVESRLSGLQRKKLGQQMRLLSLVRWWEHQSVVCGGRCC